MNTVPPGTIIGYNAVSGEELFTQTNRATRFPDQAYALPHVNDRYETNGKNYRIVRVHSDSTEILYKIDVREE